MVRTAIFYAAVEAMAEVARHRMKMDGAAGLLANLGPAAGTLLWAFIAHQRFAFKDAVQKTTLAGGALRYVVISVAVLDGCAIIHRLSASAFIPGWMVLETAKFALLQVFIWGPARLRGPTGGGPLCPEPIDR
jgi:hypothetical protein